MPGVFHFLASAALTLKPWLQLLDALRVPAFAAVFLLVFPVLARTKAQTLFLGLFEQTPLSLFLVTIATFCLSAAAADTGHLILNARFEPVFSGLVSALNVGSSSGRWIWLAVILVLSAPTLGLAIGLSSRQKRSLPQLLAAAVVGFALCAAVAWGLMLYSATAMASQVQHLVAGSDLFRVLRAFKPDILAEHAFAGIAFMVTSVAWICFGIWGYFNLGHRTTVPALASLLLLVMMATWPLAALTFFLDFWQIPSLFLVIVAVGAAVTAQSRLSDHTYKLMDFPAGVVPEPSPSTAFEAGNGKGPVIVVSAEGGGILAAAWTAQVLEGLRTQCSPEVFDPALRMISSVSGGSVGAACYIDWLLHPADAKLPTVSSSDSSLDEVAWGLTWPDLLRAVCPWLFGWTIDRAEALQRAWSHNAATDPGNPRFLNPLSTWRSPGPNAPAVIMNSTVVENGFRLLMGTSELSRCLATHAREDASEINCIGTPPNTIPMDVDVVTAARLSASFTWVTPAARASADSLKPHLVDGGYYDNYGMATLVEWLDEALNGAQGEIRKVLVLQIHSSPVTGDVAPNDGKPHPPATATRGWFFQLLAPFLALLNVRSSGQIAHNDIELELIQQKWRQKGIEIQSVSFVYPDIKAPLSWHLIEEQKQAIRDAWSTMGPSIREVAAFLRGAPVEPETTAVVAGRAQ